MQQSLSSPNVATPSVSQRGLAASLALGAGLTAPMASDAALIVQNINQTTSALSAPVYVDLDQNGGVDFQISAESSFGYVFALSKNPWVSVSGFALKRFNAGDSVDASTFGSGNQDGQAYSSMVNAWSSVGDHAWAGVRMLLGDGYHYGWIELTRGSLTVGQVGFQSTANTAAVIPSATTTPSVPEPDTLALLALGAAGALATRRRRPAAA